MESRATDQIEQCRHRRIFNPNAIAGSQVLPEQTLQAVESP
jgi:hypothetical protein